MPIGRVGIEVMANRMKREGLVEAGKDARVPGRDRLLERSIWFPYGIVRDAVILSKREAYCMGTKAGTRRSVAEEFRILETMY